MVQVEEKRLAEFLREEWKLNALEAGGVDNWDGYDYSLSQDEGDTWRDVEDMSDEKIIKDYLE